VWKRQGHEGEYQSRNDVPVQKFMKLKGRVEDGDDGSTWSLPSSERGVKSHEVFKQVPYHSPPFQTEQVYDRQSVDNTFSIRIIL
jgi:hypothetical protein